MKLRIAIASATQISVASTKESESLGEILITAERREERLREVPISVSA